MFALNKFSFLISSVSRRFRAVDCRILSGHSININGIKFNQKYYSIDSSTQPNFDREKKLKILALEIDVLRQEGRKAPDTELLKESHWEHLLSLESRSARRKYCQYLWSNERKEESRLKKKEERKVFLAERNAEYKRQGEENDHLVYALNHNTMFLRLYDTTMNQFHNNKLIKAMMFGHKIVLDCSYDEHMNAREQQNTAKQLMLCFAENRVHDDPFDIHYCNINPNSQTTKHLKNYIPTMFDTDFPINVHQESYLDLFPKERLVYLTPHCHNDLTTYNPDDIYIIGAMVDKVHNDPISLAKAKKHNLRMARLPLDKYFLWGSGSGKSLTLNQMTNIMLEIKSTGDWNKALRFVPKRKIVTEYDEADKKYLKQKERQNSQKFQFNLDRWAAPKNTPTNQSKKKYNKY